MDIEKGILNYSMLLKQVRRRVALAQQRAIYAANEELLRMYWDLGKMLYSAQQAEGWGKGTLVRLSHDMKNEYPRENGFSVRNLRCMIEFFLEYNQELTMTKAVVQPAVAKLQDNSSLTTQLHNNTIVQPAVAQLPEYNFSLPIRHIHWTHNVILIGISDYELGQALPHDLRSTLPSIEDIEAEFESNSIVNGNHGVVEGTATVNIEDEE